MNETIKKQKFDEFNNKYDLATIFCLTIPQELRSKINFSEQEYYTNSTSLLLQNSKKFYCYCLLDEIEKIGTNILRVRKSIKEETDDLNRRGSGDRIAKNFLQSIIDEQNLWIRKLTELLIEIINFSQCKHDLYFEHYLLTNRHFAYCKRISSYNEFFACERLRDKNNKTILENRIMKIEKDSNFHIQKAWYLKTKKSFVDRKDKMISGHKDFRCLLKETLFFSSANQELVLGGSYENFSRLSRSLHPNIGGPNYPISPKVVEINIMHVSLLAGNIQLEIKKIFDFRPKKGFLKILQHSLNKNPYPKQMFKLSMQPNIEKGDFVAIKNELAEIRKIKTNKFGYKSFRVIFLERDKNHPCKEDEFLGNELHLLAKKKKLIKDTKKVINNHNPDLKLHGNSFTKSYRKWAIILWRYMKNQRINNKGF